MKAPFLLLLALFISVYTVSSQNLYTQANAANITNEANSTTGWTGPANLSSVTTNPQNGTYSILIVTAGSGNRRASYSFTAVVGTVYNISIWARRGNNNGTPAFANWVGFSGFNETDIIGQAWVQYNFTVTATSSNPTIRVYASQNGPSGREVYIDAITILAQAGDTQAPSAPLNLSASNTTSTATTLSWTASTDNVGVTQYQIRRNNVMIGSVAGNVTTYNATGLTASTTYSFNVVALDAANNVSPASNTVQVTTSTGGGGGDTEPPTAPSNLASSNTTSTGTNLSWTASTDNVDVTNYRVFRNNTFFGQTGNASTTFVVSGLTASTTYSFYVVAQDAVGNNSNQSNSINVSTPTGGGGPTPYTTLNANLSTVNWQAQNLNSAGSVGIGTQPNSTFRLAVNGNVRTKEVVVESGWSDFVFEPNYYLAPLSEVEEHIYQKGHLKDIPSAEEVNENGLALAEINKLLLQKIEELTLYLIDANNRLQELEKAHGVTK